MLSVSERTIRSFFTVAVWASTLLTETLFPESLRGTTTYKVTLGMVQQYIIEQVAEMKAEATQDGMEISDDYAQRKMALLPKKLKFQSWRTCLQRFNLRRVEVQRPLTCLHFLAKNYPRSLMKRKLVMPKRFHNQPTCCHSLTHSGGL
ncbi:MAG: hypothetical protein DWQ04_10375 [Chloroflexi bacterium]|nr:MAG: hypothetical protein DWQ04_10375 [Chloroflexota bacterium]